MKNSQLTTYHGRLHTIIVAVVGCWLLVIGQTAHAATALVEIDTGLETINALEATLILPSGVSVDNIYTGSSAILIWITEPAVNPDSTNITFAGMTPGGFRGKYPLFSITGEFSELDLSRLSFTDVIALRNDGEGTAVAVTFGAVPGELDIDTFSPEPFALMMSASPEIFEGRYFISFNAQDKGTGIERYEIASTWLLQPRDGAWTETQSPHVLSRLETFKRIHIRAVDKAGNYRDESITGPYYYAGIAAGAIILLLCVLLLLARSRRSTQLPS